MNARRALQLAAGLALLGAWSRCSAPDTPTAAGTPSEPPGGLGAGVRLELALPKPLISVVDSIVAILDGPLPNPVVKNLEHSPGGPAVAVIGAIVPGTGFSLEVRGYDHDGQMILAGSQDGIAVTAGDTIQVTLVLELVSPPAGGDGSDGAGSDGDDDAGGGADGGEAGG